MKQNLTLEAKVELTPGRAVPRSWKTSYQALSRGSLRTMLEPLGSIQHPMSSTGPLSKQDWDLFEEW